MVSSAVRVSARPPGGAAPRSPRRRRLLAMPLAALLAAPARAAQCPAAVTRPLGEMVGLGMKFAQGQPESALEMLLDLRVRWVRDVVLWSALEPAAGRYVDFAPAFRRQLAFYRRHDIGLVAVLMISNAGAYPGPGAAPYDAPAFGRFAVQVARLLSAAGVRFVLELGNEPHNSSLAKALGGAWNGRPPSPWLQHYVRMVRAAVDQVKAFDASIRLLSDDDMWVLHYHFLEAGLPPALDGFAIHPYTPGIPERTAVAHDTDWTRPYRVVDADGSFASAVRRLRAQGREKLACPPEIWITEWGWPVGGSEVPGSVSEPTLAAYLPRAFILAAAAGVRVLCWFSANDSVDGPMGLTRNDGVRRDSYRALRTLTAELGDQRLLRQAAGARSPVTGLQAFEFEGPQGRTLVAWSADGRPRRWSWPDGAPPRRVIDTLGRPVPPGAAANLTLAAAPVYVHGDWSEAGLDTSLAAAA